MSSHTHTKYWSLFWKKIEEYKVLCWSESNWDVIEVTNYTQEQVLNMYDMMSDKYIYVF